MLQNPTYDKLRQLRLPAFANAWKQQQGQADVLALSFDERLALLVDTEVTNRENGRLKKFLSNARLKQASACLESLDTSPQRELDRGLIRQLGTCQWVLEKRNLIITGMTGTGKTYLACALAQAALRHGFPAMYKRSSRLSDELTLARASGTYSSLLTKLSKVQVLIIDDWGLTATTENERNDLLEILEDRYGAKSTLITSQLPVESWHCHLGDATIADAVCDRLLHNAYRLCLKGPSMRKEKTIN